MLEIKKIQKDSALEVKLVGRLDTVTAPQLEEVIGGGLEGITDLTLDFADLEYISSAGLRVLLSAQKSMMGKGSMVIRNVSDTVMEIFEVTGFSDILTIG